MHVMLPQHIVPSLTVWYMDRRSDRVLVELFNHDVDCGDRIAQKTQSTCRCIRYNSAANAPDVM
jgi:hypothetical protein